ncbi:hypothetical protein Tco_1509110 [Tanacetum coccineum]
MERDTTISTSTGTPSDYEDSHRWTLGRKMCKRMLWGNIKTDNPNVYDRSPTRAAAAESASLGVHLKPNSREGGLQRQQLLRTRKHRNPQLVDHIIPPGCFSEMRHLPSEDFLSQYNINMARQKIQVQDDKIRNLEFLIEAESDMKRAAEAKNETLTKELECAESIELRQAFADVVTAGIARGLSDGLRDGVEHGKAGLDLASLEGHDLKADEKFTDALQALKDLKYPLVDELEQMKDAPIDYIMASLYLESDTGEDAPPEVAPCAPCTYKLKNIMFYREVRDPRNPWAVKKEILLEDAIAANISRAEKKRKSRVVCRTHGVGPAHHARSDGVPVSVPVVPQGLQIVLTDASTQTELDKNNPPWRLTRASSIPLF